MKLKDLLEFIEDEKTEINLIKLEDGKYTSIYSGDTVLFRLDLKIVRDFEVIKFEPKIGLYSQEPFLEIEVE